MAKTKNLIKLVSSADTGTYYVTTKNKKTKTNKLELKKFDKLAINPKTGKRGWHVKFVEAKISSGS